MYEKEFQFLIGIINHLNIRTTLLLLLVSIPHRYYKSYLSFLVALVLNYVSIPHRYYKSDYTEAQTYLETMFQFLIGIINPAIFLTTVF